MQPGAQEAEAFHEFEDELVLTPTQPGLAPGERVLLVGDSHTYGAFGVELARLLAAAGANVIRRAKIGSAARYWVSLLPNLLRVHQPHTVVVALGANMRDYPSARGTSGHIRVVIQLIRRERPAARIVWIGPPRQAKDTEEKLQAFNTIVRAGLDKDTVFIDSAPFTPRYVGRDGVHYAAAPAQSWARSVFAELVPALARQAASQSEGPLDMEAPPLDMLWAPMVVDQFNRGNRDRGKITNALYYAQGNGPEGQPIPRDRPDLARKWLGIRDNVVDPVLNRLTSTKAPPQVRGGPVVSSLAVVSRFGLRNVGRPRKYPVFGVVVHTTSGGPARMANQSGRKLAGCTTPLDCALAVYAENEGFPHYVIDYQGLIVCVCREDYVAWHAGVGPKAREYLKTSGAPPWWKKTWTAVAGSPLALPPSGRDPNQQYIGVELLQTESGGSYTEAQYRALAALVVDLEKRHGLTIASAPSRTLLGHEDVNPAPYQRGDMGGRSLDDLSAGWDPGASRGWFSWSTLWSWMRNGSALPAGVAPSSKELELEFEGEFEQTSTDVAVSRSRNGRGMQAYTGQRVDTTLRAMRAAGRIGVTDSQLDLLQRISNVETGGAVSALNTYDSAVVSLGFMQWTLRYGELQKWIKAAAAAFQKYGIELDDQQTYTFGSERIPAIKGATLAQLRWEPWASKFWQASLDPEIIAAETPLAIAELKRQLALVRVWWGQAVYKTFEAPYQADAWLRAIYHETYNNRPAYAKLAVKRAVVRAAGAGTVNFATIFKEEIMRVYAANNEASKGTHVIEKTARGAS